MSFWEIWSGVLTAIAAVVTLLSAWFFQAPLIRFGKAIRDRFGRRDQNRTSTSLSDPACSTPLPKETLHDALELRGLGTGCLEDILAEGRKQTELLGSLLAMMDSCLPPGDRDEWIAEVRLRRRGRAGLGGHPQFQNRGRRSDVATG